MSENKIYSQKDQYGFYYDDYYNEEFDEYGFNNAGIFLKRGYSYNRGGHDIDNYHKYERFCDIKKYPDYIVVSLAYFASDTVNNSMIRYGWKYYSKQRFWINKPDNVNFEKFVKFLQYNARNQTFISLKIFDTNFYECTIKDGGKYDLLGYDDEGYDRTGFDQQGKDRNGYYRDGFNDYGFNKRGEGRVDFSCSLIRDVLLDPHTIKALSKGTITTSDFISYNTKEISQEGIFGEKIFGSCETRIEDFRYGIEQRSKSKLSDYKKLIINKMGVVPLCRTMLNPWFFGGDDSAICLLLDLPYTKLSKIANYSEYLVIDPGNSEYFEYDNITYQEFSEVKVWNENYNIKIGADAIYELVLNLDLEKTFLDLQNKIKELDPDNIYETNYYDMDRILASQITKIKNRIKVINAFIDSGKSPLWMFIDNLPVIPIDLRPYMILEDGQLIYHEINDLYRNVLSSNAFVSSYIKRGAPEGLINPQLNELQKAINKLFNNSIYPQPKINSTTMQTYTSLKEIFFDKNGLFLDLLNGCDAKQNDYIIKDKKLIKYLGCDEEVIIQDGITEIDNDAFENCNNLKYIHIPRSVEIIGENAFSGCKNLEEIILPQGIKSIELGTFSDCKSLKSIVIPPSVEHIDVRAFENCEELQSISVGNDVTICSYAFKGCKKLVNAEGYVIVNNQLFDYYGADTDIIIPSDVTEISSGAFSVRENVKTIIISNSICKLNPFAFFSCKDLTSIVLPDNIERLPSDVLSLSKKLHSVIFPKNLKFIDKRAFMGCEELQEIKLPNGLKEIDDGAFVMCKKLSSVFIPESVCKIANNAFLGCENLTIYTTKGSFAESYAKEKGIPVIFE